MVTRWTFHSPTGEISDATVELNPNEGGSPGFKRNIQGRATTAPDGQVVMFEGVAEPRDYKISGTIISSSQYAMLEEWAEASDPVEVTDDLGRALTVIFTEFTPTRKRMASNAWKHDYTMSALVLSIA